MAAAIIAPIISAVPGSRRRVVVDFTPSTSYPALGEPLTAASFGLSSLDYVQVCSGPSITTALHAVFDAVNNKLRLYTSSTGAEVGTASDQSLNKVRLVAEGV